MTANPTPEDLARDADADLVRVAVSLAAMEKPNKEDKLRRLAEWIALLRDALPAWVRRAKAAEAHVAELEGRLAEKRLPEDWPP